MKNTAYLFLEQTNTPAHDTNIKVGFGCNYLRGYGYLREITEKNGYTYAKIAIRSGSYKRDRQIMLGSFYVTNRLLDYTKGLNKAVEANDVGNAHGVPIFCTIGNIQPYVYEGDVFFRGILMALETTLEKCAISVSDQTKEPVLTAVK